MADAETSIYDLVKPEVGASADTWGSKLNTNFDWLDQLLGAITTAGGTTAYTLTTSSGLDAYVSGMAFNIRINATNTGASTLNVDGLGAKAIVTNANAALIAGDLQSGSYYRVSYDGTSFRVVDFVAQQVQPLDATLTALAALSWSSGRQFPIFTAADTITLGTITSAAETVLDDTTVGAMCTTLGAVRLDTDQSYTDTNWILSANTSDGSDSSQVQLCGGGSTAAARGGSIAVRGNENATSAGNITLQAGTGVTGGIDLNPGGGILSCGGNGAAIAVAISAETSGTLTSASSNRHLALTGNITLNNSVMSTGDKMTIESSSARTITRGSGVTMYVNGTNVASATLAANQMGGAHYRSASVIVLSGAIS